MIECLSTFVFSQSDCIKLQFHIFTSLLLHTLLCSLLSLRTTVRVSKEVLLRPFKLDTDLESTYLHYIYLTNTLRASIEKNNVKHSVEYKGITRTTKTKKKLSANYVSNEGLTPKTYKEFLKLTVKKKTKKVTPQTKQIAKQKNLG